MAVLDVWLYGRLTGQLEWTAGELRFAYDAGYVDEHGPALSHALPPRVEPFGHAAAHSFFSNLLPEGEVRRAAARWVGVSAANDFALLSAIGGDCAGAVSLLPPGERPSQTSPDEVEWLDAATLARAFDELPRRPLLVDPDGDIRISLAGAQDKLVVVAEGDRLGVPRGTTPSTHIVKTPIADLDDTVANEAFCLGLARDLGLDAVEARVEATDGHEYLLVTRYDRRVDGDRVERLHQEDFCQALGVPPEAKYEAEGGPTLADCFELVREAVAVPAYDLPALVDGVTLSYLIGNHDAHAKNLSLLHAPEGVRLAPLYDLLSTTVYGLARKMAMKIGGEYRPERVQRRHVERLAKEAGLGGGAVRRRMRQLAREAPDLARARAAALHEAGGHRPVVDRVVETLTARAGHLLAELDVS